MVAYFKNSSVFWILVAVLVIGVISVALFDDRVERGELIDDSVIVELDEGQYRFKIPVDYIHMKLVTDEFLKERHGIGRKFKHIYKGSRFDITVAYPNMAPLNLAEDKPGRGNKIMISLGVEHNPVPLRKSAATTIAARYPDSGIVPKSFGINGVTKYENIGSSRTEEQLVFNCINSTYVFSSHIFL